MATGTYTIEKDDALSRTRFLTGDVDPTDVRFEDKEVSAALRFTWIEDFLWLYQDDEHEDGPTAATFEIALGDDGVEVVVSRTIPGPTDQPHTFAVSPAESIAYDQVWELLRGIQDLDEGWVTGLMRGSAVEWLEVGQVLPDPYSSKSKRRADYLSRSCDLALTGAALSCLGSDNRIRVPRYEPRAAAVHLLQSWLGQKDAVASWREGKVGETWKPDAVRKRIAELVGINFLAVR